ncbi:hypothetical protein HPA02_27250 [Bisbaumannia pacifica]|uniref:Uncharacterized protein n=1 Tax=Bisbaumannia pacifica TaxID=77098 RepID=A0A510XAJ0_9GAMM|nr:hypothetical protein [Halomonas pacifica]GEK48442.1 hypothetical protein HPA02_27250 [Halomonas pacifica]
MEALLAITDVGEGMFADATSFIAECHFPDLQVKSARIVGPVGRRGDESYLSCHLRDENGVPIAACYLLLMDPRGSISRVDETITL